MRGAGLRNLVQGGTIRSKRVMWKYTETDRTTKDRHSLFASDVFTTPAANHESSTDWQRKRRPLKSSCRDNITQHLLWTAGLSSSNVDGPLYYSVRLSCTSHAGNEVLHCQYRTPFQSVHLGRNLIRTFAAGMSTRILNRNEPRRSKD